MGARYRVDDGGAVAFRKTPTMADRSDVHAKPGDVIVVEDRHCNSGSGENGQQQEEWVRHTNGLWLPVQFLVEIAEQQAEEVAVLAGLPPGAGAVAAAKDAQRQRLERLPTVPSMQARTPERPSVGLTLELSPSAALPSEPHLKYLRLGGKVADSLRRSDQSKAERATDLDANEKLLALATERGAVHVLDLSGGSIRRFDAHSMPVHAVHIDQDGEHIASCSNVRRHPAAGTAVNALT